MTLLYMKFSAYVELPEANQESSLPPALARPADLGEKTRCGETVVV